MADNQNKGFSSAFDEMIAGTRKRFEEHSAETMGRKSSTKSAPRYPATAVNTAAPAAANAYSPREMPTTAPPPVTSAAVSKPKKGRSKAARRLDERFGEGWRYEVTERRREGDELIVLCRVELPGREISKSQFGSARVLKPGERIRLQGTVDGIPLAIPLGQGVPAKGDPEESAFRRAVEVALGKCAELL